MGPEISDTSPWSLLAFIMSVNDRKSPANGWIFVRLRFRRRSPRPIYGQVTRRVFERRKLIKFSKGVDHRRQQQLDGCDSLLTIHDRVPLRVFDSYRYFLQDRGTEKVRFVRCWIVLGAHF